VRRRRIIHRADSTQAAIVQALRAIGAYVDVIGDPVDLLVGFRGKTYLAECKTEDGKLTESQRLFVAAWRGAPVQVWRSVAEAIEGVGL
jgi:hypothetical protein